MSKNHQNSDNAGDRHSFPTQLVYIKAKMHLNIIFNIIPKNQKSKRFAVLEYKTL